MARELADTGTIRSNNRVSYKECDKQDKNKRFRKRSHFNRLPGQQTKTLIIMGNCTPAANSPMKGYVRTPICGLVEQLEKFHNCDVVELDEFRTTQLCSFCWKRVKVSKSPDRFVQCKQCADSKRKVI